MGAGSKQEFVILATDSCSSPVRAPSNLEQLQVELRHHGCGLEARVRDLSHGELLVNVQGACNLEQLRVELRHPGCGLEARVRDLGHGELLVIVQGAIYP